MKTTFLNGEISEELYVQQPKVYEDSKRRNDVYKLHKALYGLKQAPRAWYFKLDKTLTTLHSDLRRVNMNLQATTKTPMNHV